MDKATRGLSIIMHFLLAIVYRTMPLDKPSSHPFQCHQECARAAQDGLVELVDAAEDMITAGSPRGWRLLLNV